MHGGDAGGGGGATLGKMWRLRSADGAIARRGDCPPRTTRNNRRGGLPPSARLACTRHIYTSSGLDEVTASGEREHRTHTSTYSTHIPYRRNAI